MEILEEEITVVLAKMPARIRAYVVLKDDHYTVVINEALSQVARMRAYRHEVNHIMNGDFERSCSVDLIEIRAHSAVE
jgi:hypothetical protein